MKSYLFMASLDTEWIGPLCSNFPGIYIDGDFSVGFRRGVKSFGFFHTEFKSVSFGDKLRINGLQWTSRDYKPQGKNHGNARN